MWVEMWRAIGDHGGPGWGFGECLWSPALKENNGHWPYWDLLKDVRASDLVLHLKGNRNPAFVGYSFAASDGEETSERPRGLH
jgi:putative restriction endonuclease